MHKSRFTALGLGLLLVVGCAGGGDEGGIFVSGPQQQAAECVGLNIDDLEDVVIGLLLVSDASQLPPGVTYNPQTGAFSVVINGVNPLTGTITGDDLTDGFQVGESFQAAWNSLGSGTFTLTNNSATEIRIQGTGNISSAVACDTQITAVDVLVDPTNPNDLTVTGTIDFLATVQNGEIIQGTITFDGTNVAVVTGTFMGNPVMFSISLDDFLPF